MSHSIVVLLLCLMTTLSAVQAQDRPQIPVPPIATGFKAQPGIESLAVHPNLPDPLLTNQGVTITTPQQWLQHRPEIKNILSYYAVGHMPPAPDNVQGKILKSQRLLDGQVQYHLIHLAFGPQSSLGFDIALFLPTSQPGPFPTIIFPTFSPTPGAAPLATMPRRPEQGHGKDALRLPLGIPEATEPAPAPRREDPAHTAEANQRLFERGYALVTYHYQDCGEDTIARNPDGTWAFRNTRFFPAYPNYDWGLLGAWAWGISRCIDYLEGLKFIDKNAFIATGHSRVGKVVLVAGAFDERIAISAPAGTAGGGVGVYRLCGKRRTGGEGLDDMMRKYPNWFSPHLHEFAQHPEKLPFDQHWFIALTAPRCFITLDGTTDHICSQEATRAALEAAKPVYALFDRIDCLTGHLSDHGHTFHQEDWQALLDFADAQLKRK